jgi:hypothetical protein
VRPDLPQPTHWLEEEDTLRSILFLGLKACHFRLKNSWKLQKSGQFPDETAVVK